MLRILGRNVWDLFTPMQQMKAEAIVIREDEVRVWMVGHATTLINFFGTTILTDPVLKNALPFPRRLVAPGYTAEALPTLDFIVVSHAHLDHCNVPTLRRLAAKTKTLVLPSHCSNIVKGISFTEIKELNWGERLTQPGIEMTAYRAEHWGERWPWEKEQSRGFNCYVFKKNGRNIFFGGDTGYGPFFKSIGGRHTIDIALLPISAYKPDIFRRHHMNPIEAHQAFQDLKSAHCVPIHWGSFRLSLEPMEEPPQLFMQQARQNNLLNKVHLLRNGQSFCLQTI